LPRNVAARVVELIFDEDERTLLIESKYVEPFASIRKTRKFLLDDEKFLTKARWFLGNPFLKVFALTKSRGLRKSES
jgi:hypothetical protein